MAELREELNAYYSNFFNGDYERNLSYMDDLQLRLGPKRQELGIIVPITVAYAIIFIAGICGNIATCIVIVRNKYMHTATNFYLFNLAVADILVLILGMPIELYSFWSAYPWIFGEAFCILRNMAAETSTNAAILTITAFTIERYVAICHPMRAQRMSNLSRAIRIIIGVWSVSTLCSIPQAVQFGLVYVHDRFGLPIKESVTCNLKSTRRIEHTFELSTFLFFLAPMVIITGMYALMAVTIRKSTMSRYGSSSSEGGDFPESTIQNKRPRRVRRAVINMLVAVVVAFFVCWAPFHAQRLMVLYVKKWTKELLYIQSILFYTAGVLYYISSTINPILYNIMSLKFRKAFRDTLMWGSCQQSRRPQPRYIYTFGRKILHSECKSEESECGSPLPVRQASNSFPVLKSSTILTKGLHNSTPVIVRLVEEITPNRTFYQYKRPISQPHGLCLDLDGQTSTRFAFHGT